MSLTAWNWSAEHWLPSDTHATSSAVADLLAYMQHAQWSEREIFGVHMAVEEALVNAIQHGNQEDPAKRVRVRFYASDCKLRIEITDEGPGFIPTAVADPTTEEFIEKPHGRGLLLMRSYMNKVQYVGCGNQVVMEKRRNHAA